MKFRLTDDDIPRIRERPGMYLSSTTIRGVYNLIFSLVEEIIWDSKTTNVSMEIHLDECDTFHIKCDFPHGITEGFVYVIKALSCDFDLQVGQDSFELKFRPDRNVFSYDKIEYYRLYARLKELAQLNSRVKFILSDHENKNVLQFPKGLEAMLMEGRMYEFVLNEEMLLNINFSKDDIDVSVSMIYAYGRDVCLGYVNNKRTHDGGTHVNGLYDGILHAFREYIKNNDIKVEFVKTHPLFFLIERIEEKEYVFEETPNILRSDVAKELNFVISVELEHPQYTSTVRRKIGSEEVYSAVKYGVAESLKTILDSDPSFFYSSRVIEKSELRGIRTDTTLE